MGELVRRGDVDALLIVDALLLVVAAWEAIVEVKWEF